MPKAKKAPSVKKPSSTKSNRHPKKPRKSPKRGTSPKKVKSSKARPKRKALSRKQPKSQIKLEMGSEVLYGLQQFDPEAPSTPIARTILNFVLNLETWADIVRLVEPTLIQEAKPRIEQVIKTMEGLARTLKSRNDPSDERGVVVTTQIGMRQLETGLQAIIRVGRFPNLFINNSLISISNFAEWYMHDLLKETLLGKQFFGDTKRQFDVRELVQFTSIQELKDFCLELELESIMRGSHQDWVKALCRHSGCQVAEDVIEDNLLAEIFARRNLVVHAAGIVNAQYLRRLPDSAEKPPLGSVLQSDSVYFDHSRRTIEAHFVMYGLKLWKQKYPQDEQRGSFLGVLIYRKMLEKEWETAKHWAELGMNDTHQSEDIRMRAQMNFWSCKKNLGQLEQVRSDIENCDVSAFTVPYKLAKASLLEQKDEFFSMLRSAIESEQISSEDANEWPIFSAMRDDKRFQSILGNEPTKSSSAKPRKKKPRSTK